MIPLECTGCPDPIITGQMREWRDAGIVSDHVTWVWSMHAQLHPISPTLSLSLISAGSQACIQPLTFMHLLPAEMWHPLLQCCYWVWQLKFWPALTASRCLHTAVPSCGTTGESVVGETVDPGQLTQVCAHKQVLLRYHKPTCRRYARKIKSCDLHKGLRQRNVQSTDSSGKIRGSFDLTLE